MRALLYALAAMAALSNVSSAADKPNFLIIYADDLGWGETSIQGCKDIQTPHIDSIAKNGIRFTQGYVAATYCSPSRAGLMTGRYPTRFGHEFNSTARKGGGLDLKETTLATRLKSLGYSTACVGKWHLGGDPDYLPMSRGYDEFFGTVANTSFFLPKAFVDSRVSNEVHSITDKSFYTTDAYAERSVDWIGKQKGKPWFLYLPFNAQHAPLEATEALLARVKNIDDEKRKTFAAMMIGMDDAVGKVLAKIRENGEEENTLIFFIGDNGGPTQGTTSQNGGLRGFKMTTFEGGPRVPFFAQWKGHWPAGMVEDRPVMNLDVLPTMITAAGGKVDAGWKLDGVDLTPYVTGKNSARPHETMYWRYGAQWGIRNGDMKLVVSRGGSGTPELYDLAKDKAESKDLAASQPDTAAKLQKMWDTWSAEQAPPSAPDEQAESLQPKPKKNNPRKAARKKAA
jgi:arylsulfatase A-like enzyme